MTQIPEELTLLPPETSPWFTIIVPTRNDEGNVAALLIRLAKELVDVPAEVLFVDDSSDSTPDVIRAFARDRGLAVRLLHRPVGARRGGLGGAVVAGLKCARGSWAGRDERKPPTPPGAGNQAGRYRSGTAVGPGRRNPLEEGGAAAGFAGLYRRAVSGSATTVTKSMFPRRLVRLSDPMSGFFAVRLAPLRLNNLHPIGCKIPLEVALRQPWLQMAEVPFMFGTPIAAASKGSARKWLRFVLHLLLLPVRVLPGPLHEPSGSGRAGRLHRLLASGAVGLTGIGIDGAALWLLSEQTFHDHYLVAAILATEFSST